MGVLQDLKKKDLRYVIYVRQIGPLKEKKCESSTDFLVKKVRSGSSTIILDSDPTWLAKKSRIRLDPDPQHCHVGYPVSK
jgi:hypothetical protein